MLSGLILNRMAVRVTTISSRPIASVEIDDVVRLLAQSNGKWRRASGPLVAHATAVAATVATKVTTTDCV